MNPNEQLFSSFPATVRTRKRSLLLNLFTCLIVGTILLIAPASAAPVSPFLAVDMNGYNAGGGQSIGPTEAGYQGWEAAEGLFLDPSIDWGNSGAAGLTKIFATSEGNITANLIGVAPNSFRGARNRGDNADALGDLTQDFVFAQRDASIGFGRSFIKLVLSGLTPFEQYEVTTFARDHFNGGSDSFQAWSDLAALGGLDGPGAWLDANVGAGASYQPSIGGVLNPIPALFRSAVSGPASADPYAYAATFLSSANAAGVLTIYGWADPNSFSGVQGASLLNGFQLGIAADQPVPEPSTIALLGLGLIGLAVRRRRIR